MALYTISNYDSHENGRHADDANVHRADTPLCRFGFAMYGRMKCYAREHVNHAVMSQLHEHQ